MKKLPIAVASNVNMKPQVQNVRETCVASIYT